MYDSSLPLRATRSSVRRSSAFVLSVATFLIGFGVLGSVASRADSIGGSLFAIEVTSPTLGSSSFTVDAASPQVQRGAAGLTWAGGPIELRSDDNTLIATLTDPSIFYTFDQPDIGRSIEMSYGLTNARNETIEVRIAAGAMSFATVPETLAEASFVTTMKLTDAAGSAPGAEIVGLGPGFGSSTAYFNGSSPASGSVFATQIGGIYFNGAGYATVTEYSPLFGTAPIEAATDRISAGFWYSVTPQDEVLATSTLLLVPEPSSLLGLVMVLGVGLVRRR